MPSSLFPPLIGQNIAKAIAGVLAPQPLKADPKTPLPPAPVEMSTTSPAEAFYDKGNTNLTENPLDNYINVKQNMTLSMVQYVNETSDHASMLKRTCYPMMASDLSSLTVATDRYYQITEVNINNLLCPVGSTPELGQVTDIVMKIFEPYGLSLVEKLSSLGATTAGYAGQPQSKIIWRLDIWFSGYTPEGKYESYITFIDRYSKGQVRAENVATYFLTSTHMEIDLDAGNSNYTMSFVPLGQQALSPEFNLLPHSGEMSVKDFGNPTSITFGDYIKKLQDFLNDQAAIATKTMQKVLQDKGFTGTIDQPIRTFKIVLPTDKNYGIDQKTLDLHEGFFTETDQSFKISAGSIVKEITTRLAMVQKVREGVTNNYPSIMYTIKTDMDYTQSKVCDLTGDLINVGVTFIIYPHIDYRTADTTHQELKQNSVDRLNSIINGGGVRRIYEYMFSPSNSEIINLKTSLKLAWANNVSNPYAGFDTNNPSGHTVLDNKPPATTGIKYDTVGTSSAESRKLIAALPANTAADMSNVKPVYTGQQSSVQHRNNLYLDSSKVESYNDYWSSFYSLIDVDLIQTPLETLEVRGDPRWLFTMSNSKEFNSASPDVNSADLIYLSIRQPSQLDYMREKNLREDIRLDADFSGFYQVYQVKHVFHEGKYTQTFKGFRLQIYNHTEAGAPAPSAVAAAPAKVPPPATVPLFRPIK